MNNNIVQKIDYQQLSKEFVNYFYTNWASAPNTYIQSKAFSEYSRLKVDDTIYSGNNFIKYLIEKSTNLKIDIIKFNCIDSGSRRIDINVTGYILKDNIKYIFSQYFLLAHLKDNWTIQNSILNIIN